MLIDWTEEFDLWFDRLIARAEGGDPTALATAARLNAQLAGLAALGEEPSQESPSFKRVRQSSRHPVWRVAHPFTAGLALRLIVWFPPKRPGEVVVVLFTADKAAMGDVFYDSVGSRADAAINRYLMYAEGESHDE